MDFLFHSLSDKERKEIRRDAKRILDSFSEKISKVKVSKGEPIIKREDFERDEREGKIGDDNFRKIMFDNAPNKNKDFIIAEKKSWK